MVFGSARADRLMTGSLKLRDFPAGIVRVACTKCGRVGQYRKQNLIDRYGADIQQTRAGKTRKSELVGAKAK